MILSIAELLEAVKRKEESLLANQKIKHPSIIGSMYEGLTKQILNIGIPKGSDLRIVSGLIENSDGSQSKQIDCMLVEGEGRSIPHTDQYIYDIEKVLVVIEVKKNLYSKEIKDAYLNLASVNELVPFYLDDLQLLKSIYEKICQSPLPNPLNLSKIPFINAMVCSALITEIHSPVRIVFGYDGFSSELSLRESFAQYLQRSLGKESAVKGFGPASFPNLVICGNYCLVKCNGLPYTAPLRDGFWNVFVSYSHSPLLVFLELIWAKLSCRYSLPNEYFIDDPVDEILKPFLSAIPRQVGETSGWEYCYHQLDENALQSYPPNTEWTPPVLDEDQANVLMLIGRKGYIDINDADFRSYLIQQGKDIDCFVSSLLDTGMVIIENTRLLPADEGFSLVFQPDGSVVAANHEQRRFMGWFAKKNENQKSPGEN